MDNELLAICEMLQGYKPERRFEVLKASKNDNGLWEITIKNISTSEGNEEEEK